MWTTLIIGMNRQDRAEECKSLCSALKSEGIRSIVIQPEQLKGMLQTETLQHPFYKEDWREESLLLTDETELAVMAAGGGLAAAGVEWEENQPFYGIPYVLQGLQNIEAEYLRMVYQRFHGEPLLLMETERLVIRELACEEASEFAALCREASLEADRLPDSENLSGLKEFMESYIKYQYGIYGYGFWALTDKESGEWVGTAGAESRETGGEAYLELGYALIPSRRRQGYAKEACLAILSYLKEELLLEGKIKCFVPKENTDSRKTAQSIGMLQTEDIFEEFYCYERIL